MLQPVLDLVLGSPNRVRALRALVRAGRPVAGREAARYVGGSARVQAALSELVEAGIVVCERGTAQHFYDLNRANSLVPVIERLFAAEDERARSICRKLENALDPERLGPRTDLLSAAVVARSMEDTGAPAPPHCCDVLVVVRGARGPVNGALNGCSAELREKYGVRLRPRVLTSQEWHRIRIDHALLDPHGGDSRVLRGRPPMDVGLIPSDLEPLRVPGVPVRRAEQPERPDQRERPLAAGAPERVE